MTAALFDSDIYLASFIDHALLNPTATPEQVEHWCDEALRYNFPTVCVYPAYVRLASNLLHGKPTKVCTTIGFPTGATTSTVKLYEAQEAVENGANELDVVINLGALKSGRSNEVYREIAEICQETGQLVKAILEMSLLSQEEQQLAAEICMDAGVTYLKTSTGFHGGATVADVQFLKEITKGKAGIKASGGIRTIDQALDLIVAGATRLGTSRGIDIMRQQKNFDPKLHRLNQFTR